MDPTVQNLKTAIQEFEKAHSQDPQYQEVCDLLKGAIDSIDPQGPDASPGQQAAQQAAPPVVTKHQPPPQHSPGHQAAVAAVHASQAPPPFAKKPVDQQLQEPPKGFQQAQAQALQRVKGKKKPNVPQHA